jgi:acyl carrier protein
MLRDRIVTLFAEKLNIQVPSIDTELTETGLLDSLAFVDLLVHLEHEFGTKCSLEDLDFDNFRSVARIARFIEAKTATTYALPA